MFESQIEKNNKKKNQHICILVALWDGPAVGSDAAAEPRMLPIGQHSRVADQLHGSVRSGGASM